MITHFTNPSFYCFERSLLNPHQSIRGSVNRIEFRERIFQKRAGWCFNEKDSLAKSVVENAIAAACAPASSENERGGVKDARKKGIGRDGKEKTRGKERGKN